MARVFAFSADSGLPLDFQWLRTPRPERIFSLSARPGWLRLFARESIGSWFEQALVARRQEHFIFHATTELEFHPQNFQQAAGLTVYYNRYKFHALAIAWDELLGRCLSIMSCVGDYPAGRLSMPLAAPVALPDGPVRLAAIVDKASLQFAYAIDGVWREIGPVLDASLVSDEAASGEHGSFTGAFVGMFAFDTSGGAAPADFRDFRYAGDSLPGWRQD
jgi:xylan 1,4-beta-xylosidase